MVVLIFNNFFIFIFFEEWRLDVERGILRMVGCFLGIRFFVWDWNLIVEVFKMCIYCKFFIIFMFEGVYNKVVKCYFIDFNV